MILNHLNLFCKKHYNSLLQIGLLLLVLSCQKEVEIAIPEQDPEYVVNCMFQPFTLPHPREIHLSLSRTINFLDSLEFPVVENASVSMWFNNTFIGEMDFIDRTKLYVLPGIHNLEGGTYHLEIEQNGNVIEAEDYLPSKVSLEKIIIEPFAGYNDHGRSFARVNLVFFDPPEQDNFYEISISNNTNDSYYNLTSDFPAITSESYYPTVMAPDQAFPEFLPFSDNMFDGEQVTLPVDYMHPVAPVGDTVEPHTIHIHFRTISENFYKFKTSLIRQGYTSDADIIYGQYEPMNVFSNIQGGMGVFAGYQSVDISFIIDGNKTIEHECK